MTPTTTRQMGDVKRFVGREYIDGTSERCEVIADYEPGDEKRDGTIYVLASDYDREIAAFMADFANLLQSFDAVEKERDALATQLAAATADYERKCDDFDRVVERLREMETRVCEATARLGELTAIVARYASECGECNGTGVVQEMVEVHGHTNFAKPGPDKDCPDCADIRAALNNQELSRG